MKHIQRTPEWLEERRKHIGSSDAAAVMGLSPWKTAYMVWQDKLGLSKPIEQNEAMKRGSTMESIALEAFERERGIEMFPQIVYHKEHKFMMASLDGMSLDGKSAVEIKCPGKKSHESALDGKVPEYYMPQLQHQIACSNLDGIWYYSFDGENGVSIFVERDEVFIKNLIEVEAAFWDLVEKKIPPPLEKKDYVDKSSEIWAEYAKRLLSIQKELDLLTKEREAIKKALILDADGQNCKGEGLTLFKSFRQGRVDYEAIPELEGVDLSQYRKPSTESWILRTKDEKHVSKKANTSEKTPFIETEPRSPNANRV